MERLEKGMLVQNDDNAKKVKKEHFCQHHFQYCFMLGSQDKGIVILGCCGAFNRVFGSQVHS